MGLKMKRNCNNCLKLINRVCEGKEADGICYNWEPMIKEFNTKLSEKIETQFDFTGKTEAEILVMLKSKIAEIAKLTEFQKFDERLMQRQQQRIATCLQDIKYCYPNFDYAITEIEDNTVIVRMRFYGILGMNDTQDSIALNYLFTTD
jgi:hypothetical protein